MKPYISTQRKDIENLVNNFLCKGLESHHANFEQNRANFEQGGRTGFARSAFLGVPRFELSRPSPRRWGTGGLPKITLGENPFSVVYKCENRMALSFLVLEKLKFFCGKNGIFPVISTLIHCVRCVGGLRV